jgi:hypothetical protein
MPAGLGWLRLFHPSENRWQDTVQLAEPRWYASVILLGDGKVFIMGGTWTATERGTPATVYEIYGELLVGTGHSETVVEDRCCANCVLLRILSY